MNKKLILTKKINLIYSIFLAVFTVIMGIVFILHISEIYYSGLESGNQIYTPDIVSSHLNQLIIPSILWILAIIGGFVLSIVFKVKEEPKLIFTPYDQLEKLNSIISEEIKNDEMFIFIKKERQLRLIVKIVLILICSLCGAISLVYLLNINNFLKTGDLLKQAKDMILFILPWFAISIICSILSITFYFISAKTEVTFLKKLFPKYKKEMSFSKNISNKKLLIIRLSILSISVIFIVLGILNSSMHSVFIKAVNLCTECIGLG